MAEPGVGAAPPRQGRGHRMLCSAEETALFVTGLLWGQLAQDFPVEQLQLLFHFLELQRQRGKQEAREKWFMFWGRNRKQLSSSELQTRADTPGGIQWWCSSPGKHFNPPSSLKASASCSAPPPFAAARAHPAAVPRAQLAVSSAPGNAAHTCRHRAVQCCADQAA